MQHVPAAAAMFVLVILPVLALQVAQAQDNTAAITPRAELDAVFKELLRDPTNVALNLRFAEAAARQGNVEAAVGALERLLIEHPDLPQVRLQLGLLYIRLGSYTMARAYLEQAAGADAPPEVRSAAADGLREVDGLTSRHRVSGSLSTGIEVQNNPGAAPASAVFVVSGVTQNASQSFAKRSDYDVFGQGAITDSYDLGTAYDERLETTGTLYGALFSRQHQLDLAWGEITIGPRLSTERLGLAGGTIRPYLLGSYVELGRSPYYNAYGAGIDYAQRLGDRLPTLDVAYEAWQENYQQSTNYPTARDLNGRLDHVAIALTQPLGSAVEIGLTGGYTRQNARLGGLRSNDYAVGANVAAAYGAGLSPFGLPLVTTVTVAYHAIDYDAADPAVSSTVKRSDRRWQIVVGEVVPLTRSIAVKAQFYRDINSSNISNFAYGNTSFLIGPQLTF